MESDFTPSPGEMNQAEREQHIRAYLSGRDTPQGKALFEEWADRLFADDRFMASLSPDQTQKFEDDMWAAISARIGLTEPVEPKSDPFAEVIRGEAPRQWWWRSRYGIAAAVVLMLVAGYFAWNASEAFRGNRSAEVAYRTVRVPAGGRLTVTLPDRTRISLNAGSTLRYPEALTGKTRRVFLTGEGFFDVTPNPEKPFIVHTGMLTTTVRGTSFNVSAYPDDSFAHVTVLTGRVEVAARQQPTGPVVLVPGERVAWSENTRKLTKEFLANPGQATAWQTRTLVFRRTPLADIARQLERQYGVRVRLANPALAACPVVATFRQARLDDVLPVLCATLEATYERNGKEVVIRGDGCP